MNGIAERLEAVRARMKEACVRARRDPDAVEMVAVSKTHGAEAVREAWDAGQSVFGENRVQEALPKQELLPSAIRWHLIGSLQKNKVRKAVGAFELIHSVDRLELAEAINRIGAEEGVFPRVLLEVNVTGEASKAGFDPNQLAGELEQILTMERLQVDGLMTLAPLVTDPEVVRPVFARLREYRDLLATRAGIPLATLSMGMSGDYQVAIEEGATIVRVGTAIFGYRSRQAKNDP